MRRKKAFAFVSLLMISFASFTLVSPTSAPESHRYWIMSIDRRLPGNVVVIDSLMENPIEEGYWNFTIPPFSSGLDITFGDPWNDDTYGWIVDLTVPAAAYVGLSYTFWSKDPPMWFRFSTSMSQDGYGWIFLNATGDVDCHTFSDNLAAYWDSPSSKAGEKAADHGTLPSPGPDGVAGTADDGFGDGTPDPQGSSILMLPVTMSAEYYGGPTVGWTTLFTFDWPQVYTTGNAFAIVNEPDGGPGTALPSQIHGANHTEAGQPWEFYAGLDHAEYDSVPHGHPNWNVYATYVCAWALLDIESPLGNYDICFKITEKMVREDLAVADVNCDEAVDIFDVVTCAKAFGTEGMNPGSDGEYDTPDDKKTDDPSFDGRGDLKDPRGLIDIFDIVTLAKDFGLKLTPESTS